MKNHFIAVTGNIGAGKSTLTHMLSEHFGWHPFYEANTENPYLADFYQDMTRWSFHSQVFFLGKRLEHHRQLLDYPGSVVQDRTVYEDAEIFAKNLYRQNHMSERDYHVYQSLYNAVSSFLPPPDLVIYLQGSVDALLNRINERGREFEQDIKREYIAQLNGLYDEWIAKWSLSPILIVPIDTVNLKHNPADFKNLTQNIEKTLSTT